MSFFFTKLKKNKTKLRFLLFSLLLGNPWGQNQFLNPGSHCLLPILITLGATKWQLQRLQGLKTNLDFTYLSSRHQHLPQKLSVEGPRRPTLGCCYSFVTWGKSAHLELKQYFIPFTSISCLNSSMGFL